MSQSLISRSADLTRLVKEGFAIEVRESHLLVHHVPYLDEAGAVQFGVLACLLAFSPDQTETAKPGEHTIFFQGSMPHRTDGTPLESIVANHEERILLDEFKVNHLFSSKKLGGLDYIDFYEKMTAYIALVEGPAQAVADDATSRIFSPPEECDSDTMFNYPETASARDGIAHVSKKLQLERIAIVGCGGTGSYVLDLVAKTRVEAIHTYDGDRLLNHNAFRAPGAASRDDLAAAPFKVDYLEGIYSRMHRGIRSHAIKASRETAPELADMDFVFLCIDGGDAKADLVLFLVESGTPFVDVGMGIWSNDESLGGTLRTTLSTSERPVQPPKTSGSSGVVNEYAKNIQVADLNMLNAALAVGRWKRWAGFYFDAADEGISYYDIDGNTITNDTGDE